MGCNVRAYSRCRPPTRKYSLSDESTIRSQRRWHREDANSRLRGRLRLLAGAVPVVLAVYAIAFAVISSSNPLRSAREPGSTASLEQMARAAGGLRGVAGTKHGRLVYQYSVVPGGVRDVAELSAAVAHDPDVAFHYASMNFRRAHLMRLDADRKMYISYRRHGRILWTKTAHLIRAGETVITDGKVTARTRCGNRLASKPEGLTAPNEPSEAELNQPMAMAGDPARPPTLLAQKSALTHSMEANGPAGPGPGGIPILIGPVIGGGGGATCETAEEEAREHDTDKNEPICPTKPHKPPPPPPPTVPEPGTYLLMGSGMVVLAYQLRKRLRGGSPR